jgi:RAVE protein 1 C terminal
MSGGEGIGCRAHDLGLDCIRVFDWTRVSGAWKVISLNLLVHAQLLNNYREQDRILDLDWSSTPDGQSILAVGYAHHVDLLCQQRSTYFGGGPGWAVCQKIDIQQ